MRNAKAATLMARQIWLNLYPASADKVGIESVWLAGEKAPQDGDKREVGPQGLPALTPLAAASLSVSRPGMAKCWAISIQTEFVVTHSSDRRRTRS